MTTVNERGLFHKLRMSEVHRWQIVDCIRSQSIAEHSYRVWVLAMDLYDFVTTTPHNAFDRDSVSKWALDHDLDEVFTGDIPSTAKDKLEMISPGIMHKLKEAVLQNTVPGACAEIRGVKESVAYSIVKIADIVEAILFITRYAVSKTEGEAVRAYLEDKLEEACLEACTRHHRIERKNLQAWLIETICVEASF